MRQSAHSPGSGCALGAKSAYRSPPAYPQKIHCHRSDGTVLAPRSHTGCRAATDSVSGERRLGCYRTPPSVVPPGTSQRAGGACDEAGRTRSQALDSDDSWISIAGGQVMIRRPSRWRTFLIASVLCGSTVLAATQEEADKAFADQDWPEAATAYRALVGENPSDGRSAYRLAASLRHAGELEEASVWLTKAGEAGIPEQFIEAERAALGMAANDREAALVALEAAAAAGFSNAEAFENSETFAPIAADPRFAVVLDRFRRNAAPCEHTAAFSDFDFWVGNWRVLDAGGAFQGENRIEKSQGGCLLLETWQGATGGTGTSMNYYDPATGQWVQVWVSPTLQIDIRGGLESGAMRLTGTVYYLTNDERLPFRGTWTPRPDGVVRQHFEQSNDDGETWSTWFDGYYHPNID